MIARVAAFAGVVVLASAFTPQTSTQTNVPFGQGALRPGNGVKPPSLVKQVQPRYTDDALRRNAQGDVELEAVVDKDGVVREVRVTKSLDPSLDERAMAAAREWQFTPGTDRDGQPVAVIVTLILSFRMGVDDGFLRGVCTDASDLVAPTLLQAVEPRYTPNALRAKIQGHVVVEAVVDPSGTVARARVVESLDKIYGLDDEALKAAKAFTYVPDSGTCHGGLPTWTLARLTLSFTIH
jgi:TonB family protein